MQPSAMPSQALPSDSFAPTRRAVVAAGAAAGIGAALGMPGAASAEAAASGEDLVIRSRALEVRVAAAFPRIVSYTDRATGAVLHGQEDEVTSVLVDGAERTPTVTATAGDTAVAYRLAFDGGTTIDVEISVTNRQVTWCVTEIADTAALSVGTLRIPGLALLSVRSDQPGAQLLAARIQLDKSQSGDTLLTPSADSPTGTATGCAYAVVAHQGLADLRADAHPALNSLYIDVFRESGWTSDRLQRALRDQGWHVTSEWGHGLERSSLWSHWATETDYGPDTSRGINSRLIRFVRNHQKDVFADKWPTLLGIARMGNFEGWTGKTDWTYFYDLIWTHSLPAKYLQAYPIRTWGEHEITFEGATSVSDADGTRRITTDGRLVYEGGSYLLPWDPKKPTKLYHYNPAGGSSSWRLPRTWEGLSRVALYRLTDQGRVFLTYVPVRAGRITLDASAKQPYVLYRTRVADTPDPAWGQATPLHDPGFNSGSLKGWTVSGPASVELSDLGDYELVIASGGAATVSQRLTRLKPGPYAASVQVEVGESADDTRKASLQVRTADGVTAANWTETSTAGNYVAADRKHGTRFQRLFTYFTVPEGGGRVDLTLRAAAGHARVRFDNVRVVPARPTAKQGTLVFEDFENVPQGWGPFVKGDAGGATDPRTHIAQRHAPFTQRGWNGKTIDDVIDGSQSLKSRGENDGLVYRTVPHAVRFEPGRRYRVTFRYENEKAGQYAWITAVDRGATTSETDRTDLPVATEPTELTYEFTAPWDGEAWVGLRKIGDDGTAEFSLDSFEVTEVSRVTGVSSGAGAS